MGHKVTSLFVIVLLATLLYGCQKKSTTQVTSTDALPPELENLQVNSPVAPDSTASENQPKSYQKIDTFVEEQTQVDEIFKQNYQAAYEDAQRALKGKAIYCGAIVKFYGATLFAQNDQSFVFYSDDFSKDYYWIVNLNGFKDNQKLRSFTAKRDLTSDIKCLANPTANPPLFSSFYLRFSGSDKFKLIDPGIIAETRLQTQDTAWKIIVVDNAGAIAASELMNPQTTQAQSTSPVATSN